MNRRTVSTIGAVSITVLAGGLGACGSIPETPEPPPECVPLWQDSSAARVVDLLEAATSSNRDLWADFGFDDGTYVVYAGTTESGFSCLGAWRGGRVFSYTASPEEPTLVTPLYGYFFETNWMDAGEVDMATRAQQPQAIQTWLETSDVASAVVTPAHIENFPIALTAFTKVQIAVHEGFHLFVQMPRWYANRGPWPTWDHQPDRDGVQMCYTRDESTRSALQSEREALAETVEALLDGDRTAACTAGEDFLSTRQMRYDGLAQVEVTLQDGTAGSCAHAEDLLEIEEGTADYASWTALYDLGLTSRERLLRRYRAQQNDLFYLTGAMQLHAVQLMTQNDMPATIRGIIASADADEGAIAAVFERTLSSYCEP